MGKVWQGSGGIQDTNDTTHFYGFVVRRTIRQSNISVTTNATLLPTSPLSARTLLLIFNNGSTPIYIGDSTVSTANGFPIYPRGALEIIIEDNVNIYGIVSTGTADVRIIEGK